MSHVLYFTADWCNPCKRTKPIADELSREGLITFNFIDADTEIEMVNNFKILSIPTFILIEDGKEIKRTNGAKTREQLLEFVSNKESQNG